jgi:hypothetical protein
VAQKNGLAQGRGEALSEPVYVAQKGAELRGLNLFPHLGDEFALFGQAHLLDLDFFVLKPVGRVDDHADTQGGLDRGVEKTEFELFCALIAEPLFQLSNPAFQVSIGDVEEPGNILVSQLRHQHSPELKSLGPFQGQPGGLEEEKHQPDQNQRDQHHSDHNTQFETAHFVIPVLSAQQSAFAEMGSGVAATPVKASTDTLRGFFEGYPRNSSCCRYSGLC